MKQEESRIDLKFLSGFFLGFLLASQNFILSCAFTLIIAFAMYYLSKPLRNILKNITGE
jgi:hypothetical protein